MTVNIKESSKNQVTKNPDRIDIALHHYQHKHDTDINSGTGTDADDDTDLPKLRAEHCYLSSKEESCVLPHQLNSSLLMVWFGSQLLWCFRDSFRWTCCLPHPVQELSLTVTLRIWSHSIPIGVEATFWQAAGPTSSLTGYNSCKTCVVLLSSGWLFQCS